MNSGGRGDCVEKDSSYCFDCLYHLCSILFFIFCKFIFCKNLFINNNKIKQSILLINKIRHKNLKMKAKGSWCRAVKFAVVPGKKQLLLRTPVFLHNLSHPSRAQKAGLQICELVHHYLLQNILGSPGKKALNQVF